MDVVYSNSYNFILFFLTQPSKLNTQLTRCRQRLQTCRNLNRSVNSSAKECTHSSFCVTLLPPLAVTVFVQTLRQLDVDYVTSDTEADQDAISFAIYLNCPVLSNDSDFYITIPNSSEKAYLLPLNMFNSEPVPNNQKCTNCLQHNRLCKFIRCRRFLPNGPGLNKLPFPQRPLLACLLGNDHIPPYCFSRSLPVSQDVLIPLRKSATRQMRRKRKFSLIHSLIDWLCSYGDNVEAVVKYLLKRHPKSERARIENLLEKGLSDYEIDPASAANVFSKYVNMHAENRDDISDSDCEAQNILSPIVRSTSSISSCESLDTCEIEDNVETKLQSLDLNSESCEISKRSVGSIFKSDKKAQSSLTSGWPERLVEAFRKQLLIPTFLDALFSQALVLNCGVESLTDYSSIHRGCTPLRHLIYGLVAGVELSLSPHPSSKISGLVKPDDSFVVTEYNRKGCMLRAKKSTVTPIFLNTLVNGRDFRLEFIQKYFGISVNPNHEFRWIESIALLSVLNHRSSQDAQCDIETSAVALCVGSITVCSYLNNMRSICNGKRYLKSLKKHYSKCAGYLTENPAFCDPKDSKKSIKRLKLPVVHAYAQLQSIYASLMTLFSILDSIVSEDDYTNMPNCMPLPDAAIVFPSGYLFHCLTSFLLSLKASERLEYMTSKIFTVLLCSSDQSESLVSDAVEIFQYYISCLYNIQQHITIPNLSHDVEMKSQPVKISEVSNPVTHKTDQKSKKKNRGLSNNFTIRSASSIEAEVVRLMFENGLSD